MSQSKYQIYKKETLPQSKHEFTPRQTLSSERKWMRTAESLSINQYAFLVGNLIDEDTLYQAALLAKRWGVPIHQVLISLGWVSSTDYYRASALHCGVEFLSSDESRSLRPPEFQKLPEHISNITAMQRDTNGETCVVLAPSNMGPASIKQAISKLGKERRRVAITTPNVVREAIIKRSCPHLIRTAVEGLQKIDPNMSARFGLVPRQIVLLANLTFVLGFVGTIDPKWTAIAISGMFSLVFSAVALLKLFACYFSFNNFLLSGPPIKPHLIRDQDLPIYSVLVPLYREKKILLHLIGALTNLDYPAAKLEIMLILESSDKDTIEAVGLLELPGNFETIIVPDIGPKTKPKALNFALHFTSGEYVVVYDAEDRPEPDQLRKAVALFQTAPANCICLQAKLNYYNGYENWLARQFVVEYTTQFDGLLPALARLRLPIPLGGTSNHFRRDKLKELGAWDPFNVTEDADLGIRLYRHGYTAQILDSTTYEEACCQVKNWSLQRVRWLKGWMMTYAVHMRQPAVLWRELGPNGFIGFQVIIGGLIASALIQPLFWALVVLGAKEGTIFGTADAFFGIPLWWVAVLKFILGYTISIMLAASALANRGLQSYFNQLIFIPVYWTLISIAAYLAIYKLIRAPFYWEKTEHGLSQDFNHKY